MLAPQARSILSTPTTLECSAAREAREAEAARRISHVRVLLERSLGQSDDELRIRKRLRRAHVSQAVSTVDMVRLVWWISLLHLFFLKHFFFLSFSEFSLIIFLMIRLAFDCNRTITWNS